MKKIIAFIVIFIVFLFLVILSLKNGDEILSLTTIPKSYSFVSTYYENDNIEVLLYLSNKKSIITNQEAITNCYITDKERYNSIKIELIEINDLNYIEKIKNQNFFLYSFCFDIKSIVNEEYEFEINDAILSLDTEEQTFNINLGSFYYYKLPYYGDYYQNISISKLVPVISSIYGNDTIGALNIKIKNNVYSDIQITNIKLLNNNIYPSYDDLIILEEEINTQMTLSSILGYNYDIKSEIYIENRKMNLNINKSEDIEIILPLKYINNYNINRLGFIIDYTVIDTNQSYSLYYDDFIFFSNSDLFVNEEELIINTYENS